MTDEELLKRAEQCIAAMFKTTEDNPVQGLAQISLACSQLVIARNTSKMGPMPDYEKEYWLHKVDMGPHS